jgi:diguanylate cyclase (GGDEF)-like protein
MPNVLMLASACVDRAQVRVRTTISGKFFAVLAVLAPLIAAVAVTGVVGLASMKSELDQVFGDNVHAILQSTTLASDFSRADAVALELASSFTRAERRILNAQLDESVVPAVETDLGNLKALHAHDPAIERARVHALFQGWGRFVALRETGVLGPQGITGAVGRADSLTTEIAAIFSGLHAITQGEANLEAAQAGRAHARAAATYGASRLVIWAMALGAFALGIGSMLLLTRNVVPRITRFAEFASAVAGGDLSGRLRPRGSDELARLGRALDEMVQRRSVVAGHQEIQSEFVEILQVTSSEEVAHDLLKRQVERSIAGSRVAVLNRNNSDDRLEATTALPDGSALKQTLVDAKPRSCLAVLFARAHHEDPSREPLTRCEVCGKTGSRTTCEPLLVGGEVIGSVLVEHDQPLREHDTAALRESVAQAAPVLANMRNLAVAEFRASTDGLTGLPNKRAVQDSVKRMAAHASRTLSPLSAIVLDLDHFKKINDSFGHGRGDDVLAAVGAALSDTVRASDFVGRNGGEEFIVLLPDTDTDRAALAAEKIRVAISQITVSGVDRDITASLGIASIPEHAGDGDQLIRSADRALYVAKTNGRNRVEVAVSEAGAAEVSGV